MPSTTTLSIHAASKEEISDYTMLASIDGVAFEDVKFWTFSRRARSGTVDTPRGLFGNSALVRKASSYFDMGEPDVSLAWHVMLADLSATSPSGGRLLGGFRDKHGCAVSRRS